MVERLAAKKIRAVDVFNGKFFPGSKEDMKPSYVITQFGEKISRVNLVGTVVDKFESQDGNYAALTIDDGTSVLRAKMFEDTGMIKDVDLGDMVLLVGKLKEYQGEVYVNSEVVKKIEANYEIKHKLEVLKDLIGQKNIANEIKKLAASMSEEELKNYAASYGMGDESVKIILGGNEMDYKPRVLELLKTLDKGDGVEVKKIFEIVKLPENVVENTLTELLDEGFIFEPKPSVLKIV